MMSNRIRIGVKTEEGRLRHGLMVDWNVHGTKFVGLFWNGRARLSMMRFYDGTKIVRVGKCAWNNFQGRWKCDVYLWGK